MDEAQKALQFVSISSDGTINLWTMNKSELTHEVLMKLTMVPKKGEQASGQEDDSAALGNMPAGGCCMDFCKVSRCMQHVEHVASGLKHDVEGSPW